MPLSSSLSRLSRVSPARTAGIAARYRIRNLLVGPNFRLVDTGSFTAGAGLRLGTSDYGFTFEREPSLIRNRGTVRLGKGVVVAPGNRWDIGPKAVLEVGDFTYFSPFTRIITTNSITIGRDCAIAWDVQLLDDDFHVYHPSEGETPAQSAPIVIGDHVWIGSQVKVFKGVTLAPGTIVAGGSVVTRSVTEPNCLVGGAPAKVLRQGVSWE